MNCQKCGKELEDFYNRSKKFCSDACRYEFHNKRKVKLKKCPVCGKETTTKYCSPECRKNFRLLAKQYQYVSKEVNTSNNSSKINGIEIDSIIVDELNDSEIPLGIIEELAKYNGDKLDSFIIKQLVESNNIDPIKIDTVQTTNTSNGLLAATFFDIKFDTESKE